MKHKVTGTLNAGAHFFIRDSRLHGRLIVQKKPIKWTYYGENELFDIKIVPTLLILGDSDVWNTRRPYHVYYNNRPYYLANSWKDALKTVEWRMSRHTEPLGLGKVDLSKFLKNEPRITFSQVHNILNKRGISLFDPS